MTSPGFRKLVRERSEVNLKCLRGDTLAGSFVYNCAQVTVTWPDTCVHEFGIKNVDFILKVTD